MKFRLIIFSLFLIIPVISFSQNDTTKQNYSIPDSIIENQTDINDNTINESFLLKSKLESQKLLKNLFLAGFIFMSLVVIFLFYINNVKIKQVLKMVKKQERQMELKNFEIEKLSIILNNTIDAIVIIDAKNNILWNNTSFLNLYGYAQEEIKDKKIDFFNSENTDIQELIDKVKENQKPVQFTFDFKNKEKQTIFIQRRIIPMTNSKEKIQNFAVIDTDYTALKLAVDGK